MNAKSKKEKANRDLVNEVTQFLNEEFAKEKKLKYRCYMYCHARFETDKELEEHCKYCEEEESK